MSRSRSHRNGSSACKGVIAVSAVLALSCSESPTQPPPPPPPPPPPDPTLTFDIEIRYVEGTVPTPEQQQAIDEAVAIWESVIVGDLPARQVSRPAGLCEQVEIPAMEETVDDLVVWFEFAPMDGVMGIGAWGGVCELRSNYLPAVGSAVFDTYDLPTFGARRVVHEIGHALGFGEVWDEMGLLADPSHPNNGAPGFIPATEDVTISSAQPDQNFGVPGSDPLGAQLVVGGGMGIWTTGPPEEELRTVFRFDLSGVELVAPIQRAHIRMWSWPPTGADRRILVHPVEGPWDENSVTWNTQPDIGASFAALNVGQLNVYQTGCPDDGCRISHRKVRENVQAWLSGEQPNNGFILVGEFPDDPDAGIAFRSRHDPDPDKRPVLYIEPRSHFIGQAAISAYDAAGGVGSTYPKVPLLNGYLSNGDSADGHWHPAVLGRDYMAPQAGPDMSVVTIGAMEDMGYEVDYSAADLDVIDTNLIDQW